MTWNDPRTWSADAITDAVLNAEIRDNVLALKAPPTDYTHYAFSASSYETTTSTSFVQIDATLALSLTTGGGDVLLSFNAYASNCYLDFVVNGSRIGGLDGIAAVPTTPPNSTSMTWLVQDLPAGVHSFDVYWKVASGTGSLMTYVPPSFVAREIS